MKIELDRGEKDGWIEEIQDVESFESAVSIDVKEKEPTNAGPVWEEIQPGSLPSRQMGLMIDLASRPEALLERWRGNRDSTPPEATGENEGDWSDSSLSLGSGVEVEAEGGA